MLYSAGFKTRLFSCLEAISVPTKLPTPFGRRFEPDLKVNQLAQHTTSTFPPKKVATFLVCGFKGVSAANTTSLMSVISSPSLRLSRARNQLFSRKFFLREGKTPRREGGEVPTFNATLASVVLKEIRILILKNA